jgi:hypothetical protein
MEVVIAGYLEKHDFAVDRQLPIWLEALMAASRVSTCAVQESLRSVCLAEIDVAPARPF